MLSDFQNLKQLTGIVIAMNDGGKSFTATFNADVILRMRRELCDL